MDCASHSEGASRASPALSSPLSSLPSPLPSEPPSPKLPPPPRKTYGKQAPPTFDSDSDMSEGEELRVVVQPPTRESSYAPPQRDIQRMQEESSPHLTHRRAISHPTVDIQNSPPVRSKAIPISNCDRCRKAKAKCDSKMNKDPQAPCSRCRDFGVPCEFTDRDTFNATMVKKPRIPQRRGSSVMDDGGTSSDGGSILKSRARLTYSEIEDDSTDTEVRRAPYARSSPRQRASRGPKARFASSSSHLVPTEIRYANMPPPSPASLLPPAPIFQPTWPRFRNASEGRPLTLNVPDKGAPVYHPSGWSGTLSPNRALPPPSPLPPNLTGPWNHWNLPRSITGAAGRAELLPAELVNLLIARFFEEPSASAAFVGQRSIMSRMDPQSGLPTVPDYLLLTIAAVAAGLASTSEPELHAWYATGWLRASELVFARTQAPNVGRAPEIELIQALLLLTVNWAGPPARLERFNTFSLACGLYTKLQSSTSYVDTAEIRALYWALYVTDNFMSMVRGDGQPQFQAFVTAQPDFRLLLTLGGVSSMGGSDTNTTDVFELSRLLSVAIELANMHEAIIKSLHSPHTIQSTLPQLLSRQDLFERRLRPFVSENRALLLNPQQTQPPTSQSRVLAQAIISLLHITQIALYQAPLRYEIKTSPTEAGYNQYVNISFAPECTNSVGACIESAWNLVHQPYVKGIAMPLLTAQGCVEAAALADADEHMDFANFGRSCGAEFFRFLQYHWMEWNDGAGCMLYAPTLAGHAALLPPPPPPPPVEQTHGAVPKQRFAQVPGQSSPTAATGPSHHPSMAPPYQMPATYNAQAAYQSTRATGASAMDPPLLPPPPQAYSHAAPSRKSAPPPITLSGAELRRQDGLTTPMLASLGLPLTPARQVYDNLAANAQAAAAGYAMSSRQSPRSLGVVQASPRFMSLQNSPRTLSLQQTAPRSGGLQPSPRSVGLSSPSTLAQALLNSASRT